MLALQNEVLLQRQGWNKNMKGSKTHEGRGYIKSAVSGNHRQVVEFKVILKSIMDKRR